MPLVYNANELAFIILFSHTFCWQNQNQSDLEFSIVINILAQALARAKYKAGLIKLINFLIKLITFTSCTAE